MSHIVIQCGPNRRIVRYRYGWRIERLATRKGKPDWKEDAPAYPATLAHGFEMIAERIWADDGGGTIAPNELPAELAHAVAALEDYAARARKIGQELEGDLNDRQP